MNRAAIDVNPTTYCHYKRVRARLFDFLDGAGETTFSGDNIYITYWAKSSEGWMVGATLGTPATAEYEHFLSREWVYVVYQNRL